MRVGPGRDYQVQWLYIRKGLPMEIIQEFGNWRKVRDPNGNEGWMLHSLLSGKRAAIITPWEIPAKKSTAISPTIVMYESRSDKSRMLARIEAGTLALIEKCEDDWCTLLLKGRDNFEISGYVKQALLWGVYPDETIDN